LIEPPIEVAPDGTIPVPTAPGLGVTIRHDRVERATMKKAIFTAGRQEGGRVERQDSGKVERQEGGKAEAEVR
jgi:hypothetical protein